jgi:hypothetical protein
VKSRKNLPLRRQRFTPSVPGGIFLARSASRVNMGEHSAKEAEAFGSAGHFYGALMNRSAGALTLLAASCTMNLAMGA